MDKSWDEFVNLLRDVMKEVELNPLYQISDDELSKLRELQDKLEEIK